MCFYSFIFLFLEAIISWTSSQMCLKWKTGKVVKPGVLLHIYKVNLKLNHIAENNCWCIIGGRKLLGEEYSESWWNCTPSPQVSWHFSRVETTGISSVSQLRKLFKSSNFVKFSEEIVILKRCLFSDSHIL